MGVAIRNVTSTIDSGYEAIKRQVSTLNSKVEKVTYKLLPEKVARVALPILRALPFIAIVVPLALMPPSPIAFAAQMGVIALTIFIDMKNPHPKFKAAMQTATGVDLLIQVARRIQTIVLTQSYSWNIPFAILFSFFSYANFRAAYRSDIVAQAIDAKRKAYQN